MNLLEQATAAGVTGFLHCNELDMLAELAAGRNVLEIGSFKGLSAWGMAKTALSVTCVDTFSANDAGQQQEAHLTTLEAFRAATDHLPNVSYIIGTSEEVATRLRGPYGMIFLDAMHTYEDVRDDIRRWMPRLRRGGLMVFHDYGHDDFPGVRQAVDERFGPPLGERGAEGAQWIVTLRWVQKA